MEPRVQDAGLRLGAALALRLRARPVSLFAKLALALIALGLILSFALASVLERSHKAFHLELHQQLFRPLAAQLLSETATISVEAADVRRLFARLDQLNLTNPGLAAYIVESTGRIVAASPPPAEVRRSAVAIEPLLQFIEGRGRWPLLGDDPRSGSARTIFSAAPIGDVGKFLYVILDSSKDDGGTALFPTERSYSERDALWLMLGNVIAGLLAALAATWFITTPLARLRDAMEAFDRSGFEGPVPRVYRRRLLRDEIDRLAEIFHSMAAKIAAQIDSLRGADQSRRDLFADISHDLRTPLTAVRGYVDRLATKDDLSDAERRRYLDIVSRQAEELGRLIGHMTELGKLESPALRLALQEVRLDVLLAEMAGELQSAADERELRLRLSTVPMSMRGDPDLVRRAIRNLVDNAMRESPPGGEIEVELRGIADTGCEVVVADRGAGIAKAEMDHIFGRWYRGARHAEEATGGSGLGLAIVQRIAEMHGGRVAAENRPGGGALFRLFLRDQK